jgi:hypothetical protein
MPHSGGFELVALAVGCAPIADWLQYDQGHPLDYFRVRGMRHLNHEAAIAALNSGKYRGGWLAPPSIVSPHTQ